MKTTKPEAPVIHNPKSAIGPEVSSQEERLAAIERLKTFGKRHGRSLGGLTIRELLDEARPK